MPRTFATTARTVSRPLVLAAALGVPLAVRAQAVAPVARHPDATSTLAPTGPHAVGRRLVAWTDSARRDPVDTARLREIVAWVWYPAAAASRAAAPAEPALPGAWGALRRQAMAVKLGERLADGFDALRVHARTDAVAEAGRRPVLLFTPGNSWHPTDYASLVEELASNGYVVIGIAPAGLADVVRFPDGRVVRRTLGVGPAIGVDQEHAHADALFALAQLRRLDTDADSFLRRRLDTARVGAFGHSLGGTTSIVAAWRRGTVRAAINLDGDPMGVVREARPTQPLLFVSSEVPSIAEAPPSPDSAHRELMRQGLERSERRRTGEWADNASRASAAFRVRVRGARHLDFTDAALVAGTLATPAERWQRFGTIDGARMLRLTADVVRAFFDATLHGAPEGPALAAALARWPEASIEDERHGGVPVSASRPDAAAGARAPTATP